MEPFGIPEVFSTWAGLVTLSAAIERKLWAGSQRGKTYPGIYAFLVGPAASGKTLAIREGREMVKAIKNRFISPSNITRAAFVDELSEARRDVVRPEETPSVVQFNSLAVMLNELGVFISEYDRDFLSALTDMWDGDDFVERKRHMKGEKIVIPHAAISLVGGCTPGFLNNIIPPDAWEQGFMSRVTIAYSGASKPIDIWKEMPGQEEKFDALVHDLKIIGELYGQVEFEPDALELLKAWHMRGGAPTPTHPNLKGYTSRRTAHLIKLCVLVAAAESDHLTVNMDIYQTAFGIMTQAEGYMPDVFLAMRKGGDSEVMKELWWFAYEEYKRQNRPVPEPTLMQFLSERTPAHNIKRVLDVMVGGGVLERKNSTAGPLYIPRGQPQV